MKSSYLFNPISNLKLGPLDREELCTNLSKQQNYLEWYFWEEGMADWKQIKLDQGLVTNIESLIKKNITPPPPPMMNPPPPPATSAATLIAPEEVSVIIDEPQMEVLPRLIENNIDNAAPATRENRKNPRFSCQLRTIIINRKKTFITTTLDISLGGIRVSHPIPLEIFDGECEVYIHSPNNKESVILKCSSVSNSSEAYRFSFSEMDQKNVNKLEAWLSSLPEKQ